MGIKVLVTGGRDYTDQKHVWGVLKELADTVGIDTLIHGDCPTGADHLADQWAIKRIIPVIRCPADWDTYGKSAGPRRNQLMVELKPDLIISFPGNRGTTDCVSRARAHGIKLVDLRDGSSLIELSSPPTVPTAK